MRQEELGEFSMQLEILAALVADLDEGNDHGVAVVETLLDRLATTPEIPDTGKAAASVGRAAAKGLISGKLRFAEGYKQICTAVETIRNAFEAIRYLDSQSQPPQQGATPVSQEPEIPDSADQGPATTDLAAANNSQEIDTANPEMLDFITETREYLAAAEVALIELEKSPGNREYLNEIFRCFHNVKGISGFLNLRDFQELAHNAESLMDDARSGRTEFEGECATLAFESLDMLKEMVRRVVAALAGDQYERPIEYCALIQKLKEPTSPENMGGPSASERVAVVPQQSPAATRDPDLPTRAKGESAVKARGVEEFVRVGTTRLDSLVDAVGELVIANAMVVQDVSTRTRTDTRLTQNVARMSKIIRELQELAMGMRMVALESTFHKMARVARDLSVKSGTPIDFSFTGEETELDRTMVEEISSPLMHMVRNAIDHGIEPPQDRIALGKPEKGRVRLSALHEGGNVLIRISDDGRGLDRAKLIAKARNLGLVRPEDEPPDRDLYQLIFLPGFSTASKVTDVSGRGVGMDVVKRAVDKLHGRVDTNTEQSKGTTFTIRLPLTMAIIDGMVVTVATRRFILPTTAIQESLRPGRQQLSTVVRKGEMLSLRGSLIPLFRLHRLFGIQGAREDPCTALTLVIGDGEGRCALLVDDLIGQQQVVVKPLGKVGEMVGAVSGASIMGDGLVALILDAAGIVRMAREAG
jgi:two-component system chemotaxis sensor kinase CheA